MTLLCILFLTVSSLIVLRVRAQQGDIQTWTAVGPTPLVYVQAQSNPDTFNSGRVSFISVDPRDPDHWLMDAGNGGVWETHDGGANFTEGESGISRDTKS